MKVEILNSGSKGNCAVIDDTIVIDAGWDATPKGVACFLTHAHGDHTKYLKNMFGMPIYALPETAEKLQSKDFTYVEFNTLSTSVATRICLGNISYHVLPLAVVHDAPCVSFDITKINSENGETERIFFGTDFSSVVDEPMFVRNLQDKNYDAIYIEANNTLKASDFMDVYFTEEGVKPPKDSFHRGRSFNNHCNVDYLIGLFRRAGYSDENKFTEPVTLLHKSSYYYPQNPERVVALCKMVNVTNPLY